MGLLTWIIFGGIAGWLASILAGTNEEQGVLGNIVLGILGAFMGGFIMNLIGGRGVVDFSVYSLLVAIGGAVILTWIVKKLA